jgi:hypothetical protein
MKRLDALLRKVVIQRDNGRCYVCGKQGTDVAHLFVRNKLATRWDLRNCHLLCRVCHTEDHHGDGCYRDTFIRKEGVEALDALRLESNQMVGNVRMFMEETERMLNKTSEAQRDSGENEHQGGVLRDEGSDNRCQGGDKGIGGVSDRGGLADD